MGNSCQDQASIFTESDLQIQCKTDKQTIPKINQFIPKHLKLGYLLEGKDEAIVKLQAKNIMLSPLDMSSTLQILKKHKKIPEQSSLQFISSDNISLISLEFSSRSISITQNQKNSIQNQNQLGVHSGKVRKPSSFRNIHLNHNRIQSRQENKIYNDNIY